MRNRFRVVAGGDVMLGDHPAMVGRGVGSRLSRRNGFNPFCGITPLLDEADLAIANLECALSDWPRLCLPSRRSCRAPTAALACVVDSGFNAFNLANNHSQQHGADALSSTADMLNARGIAVVGLAGERPGTCRPVDLEIRGQAFRLLGYSLRPRQHFTEAPVYAEGTREGILSDIATGRQASAVVIVNIHWGDEFVTTPSPQQIALGRALVDAGCTLVLGHHPHVLQGWERRGRGAIFYSLGNLVFDMPWLHSLRRSALCDCILGPEGCEEVGWHPLLLNSDYSPQAALEPVRSEILSFLTETERSLANLPDEELSSDYDDYERSARKALVRHRWMRNRYFLRNLWRYPPDVAAQMVGKFLLRRVGLLHD